MRTATLVLLAFVTTACAGATAARQQESRLTGNVVLVTLDGARWQEVFTGLDEALLRATAPKGTDATATPIFRDFGGATPAERREKLMPFLWRTLTASHGFIAGDRAVNSRVSVTNGHRFSYPGYSEILTGQAHDDAIRSNDPIRNPFPSVLQFIKRKHQLSAAQVATFASWDVIASIVESEEGATTVNTGLQRYASDAPDARAADALQFQALTPWNNVRHDAYTFRFAMDYLKRHKPRALYISFDETDDWAHDGNYERVLRMLHETDGYLKELWDALQADPQYRARTTLIVTTDHGRGASDPGWRRHGSDVDGAENIWLAVASPDTTRRGVWANVTLGQNQIAATLAAAMGLDYQEQNRQAGRAIALK